MSILKITTMTNLEKYNQVFVSNFLVKEEQLPGMSLGSVSVWDSVGHMGLVAAIEEAFDISLETDDIIDFFSYENGKLILNKYKIEF
jgi:acyl carrier protein